MIIDCRINHPGGFAVTDRATGAPIRGIRRIDTEAGVIERYEYGPDGVPVVIEADPPTFSMIVERRDFEVHLDPDQLRYVEMTQGQFRPMVEALDAR